MRLDLQELVEEAASVLQVPVTLEDADFGLIAFASQQGELDDVRRNSILHRQSSPAVRAWFESFGIATSLNPVLTPLDESRGIRSRLCLPVRTGSRLLGYLWAYDWPVGRAADSPEVAAAVAIAGRVAVALTGRAGPRVEVTCADLLSADAGVRAAAVAAWDPLVQGELSVIVAHGHAPGPGAVVLAGTMEGDDVFVVETSRSADAVAETRSLPSPRPIGLSDPFLDPAVTLPAYKQARLAARLCQGPPLAFAELGALRVIAVVEGDQAVAKLRDLADLTATALAFLDRAGNVAETSAALSIHRQTLYYRLARIEAITGLSMRNGRDRLRLHLALLAPSDRR